MEVDADSKSSRKSIRLKTVPCLGYSNQTYRLLDSFASSRAMRAMLAEVVILAGLPTSAGFSHQVRLEYKNLWRVRFLGLKANWAKDKLAPTSLSVLLS